MENEVFAPHGVCLDLVRIHQDLVLGIQSRNSTQNYVVIPIGALSNHTWVMVMGKTDTDPLIMWYEEILMLACSHVTTVMLTIDQFELGPEITLHILI